MKPRLVAGLLALGLFAAAPVLGQTLEVGPKAGLNWSDMLGEDSGRAEARKGFTAGGAVVVGLTDSYQVQVEGLYTEKGAHFQSIGGEFHVNSAYVEVPVLARLIFPRRADNGTMPYLLAGPAVSFEMECEVEQFGSGGTITTQDCENSSFGLFRDTKTVDVGAIFGGGVSMDVGTRNSFYLEGRLNVGVRSLDNTSRRVNVRNLSFSLLAGFGFGFGE